MFYIILLHRSSRFRSEFCVYCLKWHLYFHLVISSRQECLWWFLSWTENILRPSKDVAGNLEDTCSHNHMQ